MSRHVYALIVDCSEESVFVPGLLAQVLDVIHQRDWPEVHSAVIQTDVPLPTDIRRQDPEITVPETRLVDGG